MENLERNCLKKCLVNKPDLAVNKSDLAVIKSDMAVNKSDLAVNKSDVAVNTVQMTRWGGVGRFSYIPGCAR